MRGQTDPRVYTYMCMVRLTRVCTRTHATLGADVFLAGRAEEDEELEGVSVQAWVTASPQVVCTDTVLW